MTPILLALILTVLPLQDASRLPVPAPAQQQESRKVIQGLFKEDYAKTATPDRIKLARKLIEQAAQTKDDPPSRYVLLKEACDLASSGGAGEVAFRALDDLGRSFEMDAMAAKVSTFAAVTRSARTPEDLKVAAQLGLRLADDALAADDFAAAESAAAGAVSLARKAKEIALVTKCETKVKEIAPAKALFEKIRKAKETLAASPEDPEANLALGLFHCLTKGDWALGLPLLAKGSDAELRELAARDLVHPRTAPEQLVIADAWWDRADKEKGAARQRLRDRAQFWYHQSSSLLTGLNQAKAKKRSKEVLIDRVTQGTWVDVSDPSGFGLPGKPGTPIVIAGASTGKEILLQKFPPGQFDGVHVVVKCPPGGSSIGWIYYAVGNEGKWPVGIEGQERDYVVLLSGGQFIIYDNGHKLSWADTTADRIQILRLAASMGTVSFERIRLRRKE